MLFWVNENSLRSMLFWVIGNSFSGMLFWVLGNSFRGMSPWALCFEKLLKRHFGQSTFVTSFRMHIILT